MKASGAWLPSLRGTCGPCSSISSISLCHTCDKDKEGFAATFPYQVKVVWTAWRRGLAMVVGKQKGRAVSPPSVFSLLCPFPVKQGLAQEAVLELKGSMPTISLGLGTPDVNSSSLRIAMKGQTRWSFFSLYPRPPRPFFFSFFR